MRDYLPDGRKQIDKLRGYYKSLSEEKIRLIQQTTENLISRAESEKQYEQLTAIQDLLTAEMLRRC